MTKIEWTDETINFVTGCTPVSLSCQNCYAAGIAKRFWKGRPFSDVQCHPERLEIPCHWRKPRMIFVNSMSDTFHDEVPCHFIEKIHHVIRDCPQHIFQVLTKRIETAAEFYRVCGNPPPNLWLGVTAEDQQRADERIPILLDIPAVVRFVSLEPLLSKIDLTAYLDMNYTPVYEDKTQRTGDLRSGSDGTAGNRRVRTNLENSRGPWQPMEQITNDKKGGQTAGGTQFRVIPPNQENGFGEKNDGTCTSLGMVSSLRANSRPTNDQSQKRGQKRQSPGELRVGDAFRSSATLYLCVGKKQATTTPVRSTKPSGKIDCENCPSHKETADAGNGIKNDSIPIRSCNSNNLDNLSSRLLGPSDMIIVGCESGPKRRECKIEWIESVVYQCAEAGVPCFVKQISINGRVSKNPDEWPESVRVRQWPGR